MKGSTVEGELKVHFFLAWTSLCLDAPYSSCDFSGKLLKSLQGRDAEMPLVLGKPGALHSAGCAWVLFPEMWRLRGKGKWHGGSVTQLCLSWDTSQAAPWMPPREKLIAREKGCSGQASWAGLTLRWAPQLVQDLSGEWAGGSPCSMTCHPWSPQSFLGEFTVASNLTSHFPEVDGVDHCSVKQ